MRRGGTSAELRGEEQRDQPDGRPRERVDLYYEDGSLTSLEEGSDGATRLLPLAHDALRAARS